MNGNRIKWTNKIFQIHREAELFSKMCRLHELSFKWTQIQKLLEKFIRIKWAKHQFPKSYWSHTFQGSLKILITVSNICSSNNKCLIQKSRYPGFSLLLKYRWFRLITTSIITKWFRGAISNFKSKIKDRNDTSSFFKLLNF